MPKIYPILPDAATLFRSAEEKFAELVSQAGSQEWRTMTHDDVEQLIDSEGREVLRRLIEGHLVLRGTGQVDEVPVGSDGKKRPYERIRPQQLGTIFGTVSFSRTGHSGSGTDSCFPVDADLNLPKGKHSLNVRRYVSELAANNSYDEVVRQVHRSTGSTVGKRQIEQLIREASEDFVSFYQNSYLSTSSTGSLLVLTCDMKGVVVLESDLRPATRALAKQDQPAPALNKTKKKPFHRKRMSTVAAVYTVAPWPRTAEQVMAQLRRVGSEKDKPVARPRCEDKRVWASIKRDYRTIIDEMFREALSRDPDQKKHWVILVDGDKKQLNEIKKTARRYGIVKPRILLDIIHVLQYLWKAGKVFYPDKTSIEDLELWVTQRALRILKGQAGLVVGGMCRSATHRKMDTEKRKPIDKCAFYLKGHKNFLRYDAALCCGTPIATGIIEGACRHLISDRLDITGARWSLSGAEAVLKIRALRSSGDFDDYWEYHCQQERKRNHEMSFADGKIPSLVYPLEYSQLGCAV